jgi:hypothetical protein
MHGSRSKIPSTKSRPYIYVKFLALLGAPYIYDISRLRINHRVVTSSALIVISHFKSITLPYSNNSHSTGLIKDKNSVLGVSRIRHKRIADNSCLKFTDGQYTPRTASGKCLERMRDSYQSVPLFAVLGPKLVIYLNDIACIVYVWFRGYIIVMVQVSVAVKFFF